MICIFFPEYSVIMSIKVVLRGNCDLTKRAVPDSWMGRNSVLHSVEYNLSERFVQICGGELYNNYWYLASIWFIYSQNQYLFLNFLYLHDFISDLESVKKRLRQERYWAKNLDREGLVQYSFSDSFEQCQWVMCGDKRGKKGNIT